MLMASIFNRTRGVVVEGHSLVAQVLDILLSGDFLLFLPKQLAWLQLKPSGKPPTW